MASVGADPEKIIYACDIDNATLDFIEKEYPEELVEIRRSWSRYAFLVQHENNITT